LEKFGQKGLINSRRKVIINKELIVQVLHNLMLPEEIAIIHVPEHQEGGRESEKLEGTKWPMKQLQVEVTIFNLSPVLPAPPTSPKFSAE
jgi:hypothetical protein